MLQLSDLGPLGVIVRNCGTVREALAALVAHQHLDSEGALAVLVESGATTELGYAIYHPHACGTDHIYDCALAAMLNYLRELCGDGFAPSEILVPHARRPDVRPYRALFRCNPRFNAEVCAIRFPSRWMDRSIVGSGTPDPDAAAMAADPQPTELLQQVFRAMCRLLFEGRASGDDVARALGMNRRTLNRRLKARGVTFQCVLDEMRFGVARHLLSTSEIGLDDVAAKLGYAGTSPFTRTFNRWAGTAPGRWRQISRGAAAGFAD
jgi:AraC-like DNA-binding protein